MNEVTKNKFAEILAAAQAKESNKSTYIPAPLPVKEIPKQAEPVKQDIAPIAPELSTMVFYDLVNDTKVPAKPSLKVVDYSQKSFAIIGETKPIKDQLRNLGGAFNKFLSCGAGWIFPKTKAYTVRKALNLIS